MQNFFKKLSNAVTNLVQPRTPVQQLEYHWKELQQINTRIVELQRRMAKLAGKNKTSNTSRLLDGSIISETAMWDNVKEHMTGILECLTAEQDLETNGNDTHVAFGSPKRRNAIGRNSNFQNFNDSLLVQDWEANEEEQQDPNDLQEDEDGSVVVEATPAPADYIHPSMAEHGPCLEYFLEQKIMEAICVMGVRDT